MGPWTIRREAGLAGVGLERAVEGARQEVVVISMQLAMRRVEVPEALRTVGVEVVLLAFLSRL